MIVLRMAGGLGNQMFQYAAALQLATRVKTGVSFDLSDYAFHPDRSFSLDVFGIQKNEYRQTWPLRMMSRVKLFRRRGWDQIKPKLKSYLEPHFHYDPNFEHLRDQTYLIGYFQSEKYFSDIRQELRSVFQFKIKRPDLTMAFEKEIKSTNAVSIHIRRGDYVSNPKTLEFHGLVSNDYYLAAINKMQEARGHCTFFIFSDDPDWARNWATNHVPNGSIVISSAEMYDSDEMYLMSQCKHHIMANSSFSWWASWLNTCPNKLSIAPQSWFKDKTHNPNDLYMQEWVKV